MSKNVSCTFKNSFILQYESKSQEHRTHGSSSSHQRLLSVKHTLTQLASAFFLWVKGSGLKTLWGTPLKVVGLSHRKAPELLLQTTYSQPHLVFNLLKRFQLHGIEDVQQRGGQQDGDAQCSQHVERGARERLFCSQGQPGHSSDGQLQKEQRQPHHPSACCCVAHPLSTVQTHFDLSTGLCHNVDQLSHFL